MPTLIVNERYNDLINLVNKVLGTSNVSDPTYGYGQSTSTSTVSGTAETGLQGSDKITSEQYRDLYIDIIRARAHQVGISVAIDEFVVGNYEANATNTDNYLTEWVSSSYDYKIGDIVYYNTYLYECIEDHTSTLTFDISKWNVIAFNLNDNVHYNNTLYRCIQSYTSTGSFDLTKWEVVVDKVEEAYILGLESLATNLDTDRFLIDSTQGEAEYLKNSSSLDITSTYDNASNGDWNGTLSHIVDVEFTDAAARRHFFNAGGEIRFSASVSYAGSQAKTVSWQDQLNQMGTISFKAQETISNVGAGSFSTTGNFQLTSTYQLCYRQNGGAVYNENTYDVYALSLTADTIRFKIEFVDSVPTAAYYYTDENVQGDFTSIFSLFRPSGNVTINGTGYTTVELPAPVGVEVIGL